MQENGLRLPTIGTPDPIEGMVPQHLDDTKEQTDKLIQAAKDKLNEIAEAMKKIQ